MTEQAKLPPCTSAGEGKKSMVLITDGRENNQSLVAWDPSKEQHVENHKDPEQASPSIGKYQEKAITKFSETPEATAPESVESLASRMVTIQQMGREIFEAKGWDTKEMDTIIENDGIMGILPHIEAKMKLEIGVSSK